MKQLLTFLLMSYFMFPDTNLYAASQPLQLDHMFILVDEEDIDGQKLMQHGFDISTHYRPHKGQGTAGKFLFFENIYFEFLYVEKPKEANDNIPRIGTDLYQRSLWKQNKAFPFGIGLTLNDESLRNNAEFMSQFHTYDGVEWMKGLPPIFVDKTAADTQKPMIFLLNQMLGYDNYKQGKSVSGTYKTFKMKVTSLLLQFPKSTIDFTRFQHIRNQLSGDIPIQVIQNIGGWLLEIECDHHAQGKHIDLRPEIPVLIRY